MTQLFHPVHHTMYHHYSSHGHSGGTSENDIKIMLGIWIMMNIFWIITWIPSLYKYITNKRFSRYSLDELVIPVFDGLMGFLWGCIILISAGCWLSNHL